MNAMNVKGRVKEPLLCVKRKEYVCVCSEEKVSFELIIRRSDYFFTAHSHNGNNSHRRKQKIVRLQFFFPFIANDTKSTKNKPTIGQMNEQPPTIFHRKEILIKIYYRKQL